jgi:hypothetical protein
MDAMRMLIASADNNPTQRVHSNLAGRCHEVAVELTLGDESDTGRGRRHDPDLVIATTLTRDRGSSRIHRTDWSGACPSISFGVSINAPTA